MSSIGMDKNGDVRSASEFKEIFEETGNSSGPYKCPFCEIPYEDRCIVTECVKAPHFKLPNGTTHRNGCNGEIGEVVSSEARDSSRTPERKVVGQIEIPEALVKRRNASRVHRPEDGGLEKVPDAFEVTRRRELLGSDKTISSRFTASFLRPIVHAYKRLRKHAYDQAILEGFKRGSKEYNDSFRRTLATHPLSLYQQKLTYGNAFQGSKLTPWNTDRIYHGVGFARIENDYLVIRDMELWPKQLKTQSERATFDVGVHRVLPPDASTSQQRARDELEQLALAGQKIEWYAYGLPRLNGDNFELLITDLSHLYWLNQHQQQS